MMLEFLETGKALYVLAAVCALGILVRLTARNLYKRLIKETDNMTLTKNRYLRDLKQKTENTYRLNQGIHNSRVYLEKQLIGYRFMGMGLSGWTSLGGQMTILCFLLGGAASFGAYWYRCDSYYIVLYSSVGILAGLVTMVADYWANLTERRQQLLNALQDYMENSLFNRLDRRGRTEAGGRNLVRSNEKGNDDQDFKGQDLDSFGVKEYERNTGPSKAADRTVQRRAGRLGKKDQETEKDRGAEESRRDVDYLKNSLEQIAASRERKPSDGEWIKDLSPDELELVGQVLKQYLV